MKPFFQGKVDVFCAIYAILNGLKVTHNISTLQARDIFHGVLLGLAKNPKTFAAVLEQRTDYIALVDSILEIQKRHRFLRIEEPFSKSEDISLTPTPTDVWDRIEEWLHGGERRAVVFRFLRCLMPYTEPVSKHWTTAHTIDKDVLSFFDCSMEPNAVYSVKKGGFVTHPQDITAQCLYCIEPHAIRFIAPSK